MALESSGEWCVYTIEERSRTYALLSPETLSYYCYLRLRHTVALWAGADCILPQPLTKPGLLGRFDTGSLSRRSMVIIYDSADDIWCTNRVLNKPGSPYQCGLTKTYHFQHQASCFVLLRGIWVRDQRQERALQPPLPRTGFPIIQQTAPRLTCPPQSTPRCRREHTLIPAFPALLSLESQENLPHCLEHQTEMPRAENPLP